jgi:hypothetical protein
LLAFKKAGMVKVILPASMRAGEGEIGVDIP